MKLSDTSLVVFDLDGTLIHYEFDLFYEQALKILPRLDYGHLTREDLHIFFERFNFFGFVPESQRQAFEDQFWAQWTHELHTPLRPFDAAPIVLESLLDQGKRVAIATARNGMPEIIRQKLEHAGLLKYIQHVSTKYGCNLPWWDKSKQLQEVCRALMVPPAEAAMIGDVPPDISSAHNAAYGLTIALLSGGIRREVLEEQNPHLILPDLDALIPLLKK